MAEAGVAAVAGEVVAAEAKAAVPEAVMEPVARWLPELATSAAEVVVVEAVAVPLTNLPITTEDATQSTKLLPVFTTLPPQKQNGITVLPAPPAPTHDNYYKFYEDASSPLSTSAVCLSWPSRL